jgi:hypothetical protein
MNISELLDTRLSYIKQLLGKYEDIQQKLFIDEDCMLEEKKTLLKKIKEKFKKQTSKLVIKLKKKFESILENFSFQVDHIFEGMESKMRNLKKKFILIEDNIRGLKNPEIILNENFHKKFSLLQKEIQKPETYFEKFQAKKIQANLSEVKMYKLKKETSKIISKEILGIITGYRFFGLEFLNKENLFDLNRDGHRSDLSKMLKRDEVMRSISPNFRSNQRSMSRMSHNSLIRGSFVSDNQMNPRNLRKSKERMKSNNSKMAGKEESMFSINSKYNNRMPVSRVNSEMNNKRDNSMRNTNSLIEMKRKKSINRINKNRQGRNFGEHLRGSVSVKEMLKGDFLNKERLNKDHRRIKKIKERSVSKNLRRSQIMNALDSPEKRQRRNKSVLANSSKSSSLYQFIEDKEKKTNPSLKSQFNKPNLSPVGRISANNSKSKDWKSVNEVINIPSDNTSYKVID